MTFILLKHDLSVKCCPLHFIFKSLRTEHIFILDTKNHTYQNEMQCWVKPPILLIQNQTYSHHVHDHGLQLIPSFHFLMLPCNVWRGENRNITMKWYHATFLNFLPDSRHSIMKHTPSWIIFVYIFNWAHSWPSSTISWNRAIRKIIHVLKLISCDNKKTHS